MRLLRMPPIPPHRQAPPSQRLARVWQGIMGRFLACVKTVAMEWECGLFQVRPARMYFVQVGEENAEFNQTRAGTTVDGDCVDGTYGSPTRSCTQLESNGVWQTPDGSCSSKKQSSFFPWFFNMVFNFFFLFSLFFFSSQRCTAQLLKLSLGTTLSPQLETWRLERALLDIMELQSGTVPASMQPQLLGPVMWRTRVRKSLVLLWTQLVGHFLLLKLDWLWMEPASLGIQETPVRLAIN